MGFTIIITYLKTLKKSSEKGLTLLEALLSTAIVGIGFVAVFQLVNFSINSIDISSERTKVNYLTGMIAEDIIGHRDSLHGVNPNSSDYGIDSLGNVVGIDGDTVEGVKFSQYLVDGGWNIKDTNSNVCSPNKGKFLSKSEIKNIYDNQKNNAPQNKISKWEELIGDDRIVKCKNNKDVKSVEIFKICPNSTGNNCLTHTAAADTDGAYVVKEDVYIGRIQINTNGGRKSRFLYFQADYIFKK